MSIETIAMEFLVDPHERANAYFDQIGETRHRNVDAFAVGYASGLIGSLLDGLGHLEHRPTRFDLQRVLNPPTPVAADDPL